MNKLKLSYCLIVFSALVLFVSACDSSEKPDPLALANNQNATPWEKLVQKYDTLSPEFVLPEDDDTTAKQELTKEEINQFFLNANFHNIPGAEVADIQTDAENNGYFAIGRVKNKGFITLVTLKESTIEEGNNFSGYYFLTTHSNDGTYIDGLCLSYRELIDGNDIIRKGIMLPDGSVQIKESENGKEISASSNFLQLEDDGRITPIEKNPVSSGL